MQAKLKAFWNEENGQDMVEYALLLGVMALIGTGVLTGLRNEITNIWRTIGASYSASALS